jgi:hypothetical protein
VRAAKLAQGLVDADFATSGQDRLAAITASIGTPSAPSRLHPRWMRFTGEPEAWRGGQGLVSGPGWRG